MSRKARAPILTVMKYSSRQSIFFCVKSKVKAPVVKRGAPRNLVMRPTLAVESKERERERERAVSQRESARVDR